MLLQRLPFWVLYHFVSIFRALIKNLMFQKEYAIIFIDIAIHNYFAISEFPCYYTLLLLIQYTFSGANHHHNRDIIYFQFHGLVFVCIWGSVNNPITRMQKKRESYLFAQSSCLLYSLSIHQVHLLPHQMMEREALHLS